MRSRPIAVLAIASAMGCIQDAWTEKVERDLGARLRGCGPGYRPAAQPDACVVDLQSTHNPCTGRHRAAREEAGRSSCGDAVLIWERGPYEGHDCFFDATTGALVGWSRFSDGNLFCGLKASRVVAGQFPTGWH